MNTDYLCKGCILSEDHIHIYQGVWESSWVVVTIDIYYFRLPNKYFTPLRNLLLSSTKESTELINQPIRGNPKLLWTNISPVCICPQWVIQAFDVDTILKENILSEFSLRFDKIKNVDQNQMMMGHYKQQLQSTYPLWFRWIVCLRRPLVPHWILTFIDYDPFSAYKISPTVIIEHLKHSSDGSSTNIWDEHFSMSLYQQWMISNFVSIDRFKSGIFH